MEEVEVEIGREYLYWRNAGDWAVCIGARGTMDLLFEKGQRREREQRELARQEKGWN